MILQTFDPELLFDVHILLHTDVLDRYPCSVERMTQKLAENSLVFDDFIKSITKTKILSDPAQNVEIATYPEHL